MNNLDALQMQWAAHDRKLDEVVRLNRQLLGAAGLGRSKTARGRLAMLLGTHAAAWFVASGALGNFIYEHLTEPRFAVAAGLVDVLAIVSMALLIGEIVAIMRVDYGQPVAVIQKQLEMIRIRRIRYVQMAVLAGTMLWTPAVIVVLKALWDVDAYVMPGIAWLASNLVFTIAVVVAVMWVSKRFGERLAGVPWLRRLTRDLAGHNVNAARDFLGKVAEFESE